jgi:hypothetical protein
MIEIIIDKTRRNYKSHGLIDHFIDDLIHESYDENDLIQYLECKHLVQLIVNEHEEELLNKLVYPQHYIRRISCLAATLQYGCCLKTVPKARYFFRNYY